MKKERKDVLKVKVMNLEFETPDPPVRSSPSTTRRKTSNPSDSPSGSRRTPRSSDSNSPLSPIGRKGDNDERHRSGSDDFGPLSAVPSLIERFSVMLPPDPPKDSKSAAIQKLRLAEETLRARSRSIVPAQERSKLLYAASRIDTPKAALQLVQESILSHSVSDSFLTVHMGESMLPHDALIDKATEETKRIKSRMYQRAHSFSVRPRLHKPIERRKTSICNRVIANAITSKYEKIQAFPHHVSFAPSVTALAEDDLSEDSEDRSVTSSPQTEETVADVVQPPVSANSESRYEPLVEVSFFTTEIQLTVNPRQHEINDENVSIEPPKSDTGPCQELSHTQNSFSSSGRNNSEVSAASSILSTRAVAAADVLSIDKSAVEILARDVAAYLSAFMSSDDSDEDGDPKPRVAVRSNVKDAAETKLHASNSPFPQFLVNSDLPKESKRLKEPVTNQPVLPPLSRDRELASTPQKNLLGYGVALSGGAYRRRRSETDAIDIDNVEEVTPRPLMPAGPSPAPPAEAPLTRTGSWKAQHRKSTGSTPFTEALPPSALFLSPVKSPPLVPALALRRNSGQSAHAGYIEASPDSFISSESFPRQRGGLGRPNSAGIRGPETTIYSSRSGVSSDFDFDVLGVRRLINSRASSRQDLLDGKSDLEFVADEDERSNDATSRIVLNAAVLEGVPVLRYDYILGAHSGVSSHGSAGDLMAPSPYPGAVLLKKESSGGSKSMSSTVSSCDKKLSIINDVPIISTGARDPEQKWLKNVVEGYLTSAIVATSSVDFARSLRLGGDTFAAARSSGRHEFSRLSDENEINRDGFFSARSEISSFSSDLSFVATRNVLSELNPALASLAKAVVLCQEKEESAKPSSVLEHHVMKHSVVPSTLNSLTSSDDAKMPISPVAVIRKKRRSTLGSAIPNEGDNKNPPALLSSEVNIIQTIDEDSQFSGASAANPEMRLFPEYFSKFPITVGRRRAARNMKIKRQYQPVISENKLSVPGTANTKSICANNEHNFSVNITKPPAIVTNGRDILIRKALKNALRAGQLIADLISNLSFIE